MGELSWWGVMWPPFPKNNLEFRHFSAFSHKNSGLFRCGVRDVEIGTALSGRLAFVRRFAQNANGFTHLALLEERGVGLAQVRSAVMPLLYHRQKKQCSGKPIWRRSN